MPKSAQYAPYGTACSNCAHSKSRCVAANPDEPCQRCQRLGKECVPSGGAKRRRTTASANPAKKGHLEAKIDQLVTLLTSRPQSTAPTNIHAAFDTSLQPLGAPPQPCMDKLRTFVTALSLTVDEQAVLDHFCEVMQVQFPFLSLPKGTDASALRETKPFLWLCIIAVSLKSTAKQQEVNAAIRNIISQLLVVEFERNIEMLQGILVCLAWGNFHVNRRPFLTLFIQLANSIVFDLALNQAPSVISERITKLRIHRPWPATARTFEERRALLACYYIGSAVSSFLRCTDRLLWTPYMSECLEVLSSSKEDPGDLLLVTNIKIRRILENAHYSPADWPGPGKAINPDVPVLFVANTLQTQLEKVKKESSATSLSQNNEFLCHLRYAEFAISEFAISEAFQAAVPSRPTDPQDLYTCSKALESFFEIRLLQEPGQYTSLPLTAIYPLMHCTLSLRKVSVMFAASTYNSGQAAKLMEYYEQITQNMRAVPLAAGIEEQDGPPSLYTRLATMLEEWKIESDIASNQFGGSDTTLDGSISDMIFDDELLALLGPFGYSV